jgi:putative copper export protein
MIKDKQQTHLSTATTHLSEVATLCLLALVLTGFADSLRMYQMADNFWQSDYARLLFAKLSLMIGGYFSEY